LQNSVEFARVAELFILVLEDFNATHLEEEDMTNKGNYIPMSHLAAWAYTGKNGIYEVVATER